MIRFSSFSFVSNVLGTVAGLHKQLRSRLVIQALCRTKVHRSTDSYLKCLGVNRG